MMLVIPLLFSLLCMSISNAYVNQKKFSREIITKSNKIYLASYEQMLEQAKARKSQPQQNINTPVKVAQTITVKKDPKPTTPVVAPQRKINKSGLPFDDSMYENMRFVIEKLTAKLRNDISLSPEELIRLKKSVRAIISDAVGETTSINTVSEVADSKSSNDSDDVFSDFRGLRSTWEVKGAENMSTEDYYKVVNQRIAAVKSKRKSLGEDTSTESYLNSLSRPRQ
mmetsp:Transcript_29073/g.41484  ORF Transcript_29073/g.41484 Transcript_29073/m.41484 type:complete len:226 (+) Transcript_29073:9-686(+)